MRLLHLFLLSMLMASCASYDAGQDMFALDIAVTADGTVMDEGITVTLRNNMAATFSAVTDAEGVAHFVLPAGIYEASVSQVTENEYFRHIYNGTLQDLVVGTAAQQCAEMRVVTVSQTLENPLLIKEIYCGGCQMDDGSGTFAKDKCIILYNNSPETVSLDSIAFGIIEPYNAEANSHNFLNNGKLDYADEDWIPAINGIWHFQDGQSVAPYSEVVVNVYGAIDNTLTYSNSINYANPAYYTMYDPTSKSNDGISYSNTLYYASPSELIPTSHYLKAVKYGRSNAWTISNTSPAVIIFKPKGYTPQEYADGYVNVIYPSMYQGNITYACLKVLRSWVLDAVEVYNSNALANSKKRLTPDLDNGYISFTHGYGHAVVRKVEKYVDGHPIYQDTNNSTNDFYEAESCSIK